MAIIQNNHVSVSLIPEDEKVMAYVMAGCTLPRPVEVEDMHVSLLYAKRPIMGFSPKSDIVHSCEITGASITYDPVIKAKNLVVTFDAPSLLQRRNEIMAHYRVDSIFNEAFVPQMVIVFNMPDFNSTYKPWINQMMNDFNTKWKGTFLRFSGELLESTDSGMDASGEVNTKEALITQTLVQDQKDAQQERNEQGL